MSTDTRLHYLGHMTWPEVAELSQRTNVVLIPTGATEAHGPHLPLETDVIIALGSCSRAARRLAQEGIECLITPPLHYGVTNFGLPFAGTISISEAALSELIMGICGSLARHGFTVQVFSNHHLEPAHFDTLKRTAREVTERGIAHVAVPDVRDPRWAASLSEEFRAGARHGGAYETSLVMAERPALVREAIRAQLPPVWIDLPQRIREGARSFKEAGSAQAYFGNPAAASVEEGEQLFAALADMLVTTVKDLLSTSREEQDGR
ncbi:MAG: creatininase family protein [Ardenticatenia bacterium]|nr:creatininase family protein [Ardenticatenia bacterium]